MTALFDLEDVQDDWQPLYYHFDTEARERIGEARCRDCGRLEGKFPHTNACSGARPGLGLFTLCDDCAALEGRGQRLDAPDVSRWGIQTTDAHAAALTETRARHRATYWATHPGRQ